MTSWEIIVRGRVQGVGFRRFALKSAQSCGIRGYVKNLVDGSVFILAQGEALEFETFCSLIRAGNRFIQVENLIITELDRAKEFDDFKIQ